MWEGACSRWRCVSHSVLSGPPLSGASPLPQWNVFFQGFLSASTHQLPDYYRALVRLKCGRGLAPDGGVSVTVVLSGPPLSGASPLPQWNVFFQGFLCASTHQLPDYYRALVRLKCGRGLAPDGDVSVTVFYLAHRYREQAPSHSGMCFFQAYFCVHQLISYRVTTVRWRD